MTLSTGTIRVGYEVTISRQDWSTTLDGGTEWLVAVQRLSDGQEIRRVFSWRWTARRFARSTRRIGRAFEAAQRWRDSEREHFRIGWAE